MRTTSHPLGGRAVPTEWPLLLLVFLAGVSLPKPCPGQKLLKNIQADPSVPGNSQPYHFRGGSPLTYFWTNLSYGALWRTDGTKAGTIQLLDKQLVRLPGKIPTGISWKGKFYCSGEDLKLGTELFRSDGTPRGTLLLKDLFPGRSSTQVPNSSKPRDFVATGTFLYFHANTSKGDTLFRSDGTAKGTIPLYHSPGTIADLTPFGNKVVFRDKRNPFVPGGGGGISDGTPAGTQLITKLLLLDNLTPSQHFGVLGGKIFFQARTITSTKGEELWVSDGTSKGTKLFKDLWPGSNGSSPTHFTVAGSKLFFSAYDKNFGNELWVSDGTPGGTKVIRDMNPGPRGSGPFDLKPFGNKLLFSAYTPSKGEEPWISDGTAKGTFMLKDLNPGSVDSHPHSFVQAGKLAFFLTYFQSGGEALYKTDGTPGGTRKVIDLPPLSKTMEPQEVAAFGNRVIFKRNDPKTGEEPWISDGTPSGTKLIKDLAPDEILAKSSCPREFTRLGDRVFFAVQPDKAPPGLWQTDGSSKGTTALPVPLAGTGLAALGDRLVWVGKQGGGSVLLSYEKRTRKTRTLFRSSQKIRRSRHTFSGFQLYSVTDPRRGPTLLITDGTQAGTKTFVPPSGSGADMLTQPLPFGKRAVLAGPYQANPKSKVLPLWITDGTSAGTRLLATIPIQPPVLSIELLAPVRMGKELFFFLKLNLGPLARTILWKTDGTPAGTIPVKAFQSTFMRELVAWKGKLFFAADDSSFGLEPWVSDGTPAGTKMLRDLWPGFWSSNPNHFTPLGQKLLFQAWDPKKGVELFVTDGTQKGTSLLKDVHPGFKDGVGTLFALGSRYVGFLGDDGTSGLRFWVSDGTFAGTRPASNRLPGNTLGNPFSPALLRGQLFFSWPDSVHGVEPFTWFPGASARAYGRACGTEPLLEATDPVLGGRVQFRGELDPRQGVGVLLLGSTAPYPLRVGQGCRLQIAPFGALLPIPVQAKQGSFKLSFGVPGLPSLNTLLLQAQVLHPLQGGGFDLSNPVELVLGR